MLERRQVLSSALAIGGAIGSASLCGPLAAAPRARSAAGLTPLQKFVRIRCSAAGRRTTWWYSGQLLGRVGNAPLQPLFSIVGASQTIGKWRDDGSFSYEMIEAGYYGALDPAAIADAPIINPLTGELVKAQHYLSPQKIRFTPALKVEFDQPVLAQAGRFSGTITPPDEKGDRIWMAEHLLGELYATPDRPSRVSNSMANFEASLSAVLAGGAFVPATMQYTTFNSFRPWMNMGAAQGSICSRLNAVKLDSWKRVPAALRSRIATDHPGVFFDA